MGKFYNTPTGSNLPSVYLYLNYECCLWRETSWVWNQDLCRVEGGGKEREWAIFFCKSPDGKYFQLCRPYATTQLGQVS